MLAVGWIGFPYLLYKSYDQPFQFSHKIHTGESAGLSCEDCHSFTEDGRFTGIPPVEKCASCHSAQLGSTNAEKILVEKYVSLNKEIPWYVYARQPENVYFSHIQHVKNANIDCVRCHGPHGSSDHLRPYQENRLTGYSRDIWGPSISGIAFNEWDGMKMSDCSRCHQERGIEESCFQCHK